MAGLLLAMLVLAVSDAVVLHAARMQAAGFDESVRLAVHSLASPALTLAMRILTWLGATVTLIGLALATAVLLRRRGLRHRAWLPLLALVLGEALTEITKLLVRRPRPDPFFGLRAPESWSFPSGHSLNSMFAYLVFGAALLPLIESPRARQLVLFLSIAVPLLIGLTRVYLGVHWPTDVLTGWVAGGCAAAGLIRAGRELN